MYDPLKRPPPVWKLGYPARRSPQIEKTVPWHKMLPMELKNRVSGKNDRGGESVCLQEMATMYACMKAKEFKDSMCTEEIATYNKCYFAHLKEKLNLKAQLASGQLAPSESGLKKLNHRQLNALLGKYPQYNYKEPKK